MSSPDTGALRHRRSTEPIIPVRSVIPAKAGISASLSQSHDQSRKLRQLCLRRHGGFGLIETLVATGIGAVLAYGVLRMSLVAVQTAQVSSTIQAENDLAITIKRMLAHKDEDEPKDCRWNLKPSRLSDSANKKGKLPAEGWIKTQGDNDGTTAKKKNDITVLKSGDFQNGVLSIKSLELLSGGTAPNQTWTFAVFYTKPQSGSYKTLGGRDCDPTATPPKKAGCYSKTCDLEMEHTIDNSAIDKCSANCHGGDEGLATACSSNQYLKGIKSDGTPDCQGFCGEGEVISGFYSATDTKPDGKKTGDPKCTRVPKFKDTDSSDNTPAESTCSAGEFLVGITADGSADCVPPCTGGRYWNKDLDPEACACKTGKTWDGVSCKSPSDISDEPVSPERPVLPPSPLI